MDTRGTGAVLWKSSLTWLTVTSCALTDLLLPGGCAGCGAAGSALCPACRDELAQPARPARPTPSPEGLPDTWAAAAYDGPARAAILAYKEHARLSLAVPLGDALARSLSAAMRRSSATGGPAPLTVVPMPSRAPAVRARGHDAVRRMAQRAAGEVRRTGGPVEVLPVLRSCRGLADQAGLNSAARAANLDGALEVPARFAQLVAGRPIVVVDDVITTGASLAEAARALRAAGATVSSAAVVAATRRRQPPPVAEPRLPPGLRGD